MLWRMAETPVDRRLEPSRGVTRITFFSLQTG